MVADAALGPETVLFEDLGKRYCIGGVSCLKRCGGSACEVRNVYVIRLREGAHITGIQLVVADASDATPGAGLRIRVDGAQIESVPKAAPAVPITIPVRRAGQVVTVEAVPAALSGTRAEFEAIISDIRVSGRAISGGRRN